MAKIKGKDFGLKRAGGMMSDQLGRAVNRALFADDCQRLSEWVLIGPVQRAALESFSDRLLAAERERWAKAMEAAEDASSGMVAPWKVKESLGL